MQLYPLDQATAPRPPVKRCLGGVLARSGNGPVPCVHEDGEAALLPEHRRRTGKGANDKGKTELEAMAPSTSTWIYPSWIMATTALCRQFLAILMSPRHTIKGPHGRRDVYPDLVAPLTLEPVNDAQDGQDNVPIKKTTRNVFLADRDRRRSDENCLATGRHDDQVQVWLLMSGA
ncbi:hypothetical protein MCOR32_002213 [Pyricularia oryzae]|nr:hypothetical protein MCOR32_002213 [Pyricularia oryzae]